MPFLNTKKERRVVILDIGSASIGGAVVSIKKNKPPVVLYTVRKQIIVKENIDFQRFLYLMSDTLDLVLMELEKSKNASLDEVFCILSSPWYTSMTHFMKIERKESFTVTRKMIDDLINKKVSMINNDVIKKKKIAGGVPRVIDVQSIQIKLNGYETNNPYGKKVNLVEAALFVSIGSEKTIKLIEDKVSRVFRNKVRFSSFSLASFVAIRDIFNEKSFLFIDITGEVTDVSMVKNNILIKNIAFPLGKNFLIRRIASSLNTTIEEAESLFSMFNSGSSDAVTNDKLNKILNEAKKEWVSSFAEILQSFSESLSIPNSVFITADKDIRVWFKDAIKKEEFGQFTITNDEFDIKILDEKLVGEFCLLKNNNISKDPFIMLEAIFVDRII